MQSVVELINDDLPLNRNLLAKANDLRLFQLIVRPGLVCPGVYGVPWGDGQTNG